MAAARAPAAAEVPGLGGGAPRAAPRARRRPESLGVRGGARRGGGKETEEEGEAESWLPSCRAAGEEGCVWSRCALRAESASC